MTGRNERDTCREFVVPRLVKSGWADSFRTEYVVRSDLATTTTLGSDGRGLHSVGERDMIEAINGIGHAAVATDPEFRAVLAAQGFPLDAETGEIEQLAPHVGAFSARTAQIHRNIDRYKAEWRREHPVRGRGCARRGIGGRGPLGGRTRSYPRTVLTWSHGGTTSCGLSATATLSPPPSSRRPRWPATASG